MKPSEAVITGQRRCLGYIQISAATMAAAVNVLAQNLSTVPNGPPAAPLAKGTNVGFMMIQQNVAAASVRWRDDTGLPTASLGALLPQGELDYTGDFWNLQVIVSVGSPILDIVVYE